MAFFNNPEIKKSAYLSAVFSIAVIIVGFILGTAYGVLMLITCIVFNIYFYSVTYTRYKKINSLSIEIDKILHGKEDINLSEYSEGEIAILQNAVLKLTVVLREQASALKKDKLYLADSIADISHQIRTPLTSINLLTTMLSKPDVTEDRRYELIKQLEMLLARIDWLISSLLKMSKLDAGTAGMNKEKIKVIDVIRRAIEPVDIAAELRQQRIDVSASENESFIGDLKWTVEAIENILKNCMEHTPVGGVIKVTASENALYTEIIISDSGCGIDNEDLPHLFERFYKGKNSSEQSVGIGLALARMIVTNQNGTIKAENHRDSGARFIIRFYKGAV